jgi:hypothetical protein
MPLGKVAPRFVLIGDPGQIPPVVSVDSARWETAFVPPHVAAPEILRSSSEFNTVERWQDLKRKVMLVVHPRSGMVRPPAFDLETGRLCVMASRHKGGRVIVSRARRRDARGAHRRRRPGGGAAGRERGGTLETAGVVGDAGEGGTVVGIA